MNPESTPSATPKAAPRPFGWAAFKAANLFDYRPAAVRYWAGLTCLGVLALALSTWTLAADTALPHWQVIAWLVTIGVAAAFPIQIPRSTHSIAAGDVLVLLLLGLHGVAAAVIGAAIEGLVASSRTSTRISSPIVSAAAAAVAMSVGGTAFTAVQPWLEGNGLPAPAAHMASLAIAAAVYCVVSTGALIQLMCVKRGVRLGWRDWFQQSSWVGTLYLVASVVAGLLSLNAREFGRSSVAMGVLIMGLSLALLRAHFRHQISEHDAQEARVTAAELEAQQNLRRFHSAFSQASIGMAIVGDGGLILQCNQALHDLLGFAPLALLQRHFRSLLHPGDAGLLDRHVRGVLERRDDRFSIELRCMGADQREIWVSAHCALFDDPATAGAGLIYQLHDITSRRHAEGELRHIAYHDALTDLANRNCFRERLHVAVGASREDRRAGFAVMMIDLDRFKIVNDSLGHPAGDELLKEVARRLAACVRPRDLVARLGGDEFAILLEESCGTDDAVRLGERLLEALSKPALINGTELRPNASIGLTFSDMGYREPDEILRDADLAMYQAKAGGKGRLALFDASLHAEIVHKLQLESDLRRAIGEGQLSLAYQPLYFLEPHRLNGFEALARWTHPVRGSINPGVFIALAEETGCIEALTAWAIDEAVRQHAQWQVDAQAHGDLAMHVNVSGKDLAQKSFVPNVRSALQRHGLKPGLLVLEITESTLMEHRDLALQALAELCELGVKVGIDDFGTGYSSLAYLSMLPFDCLKIDRSFVIGMEKSRQNLEIVRTVISLAQSLNKQVVAEGIETHEQLVQLRKLGATIGQGYLLSRPLNAAQALQLLREPQLQPA